MGVSPARKIAFDVLRRVEAEGAYASDALHAELTARIKPADAALATELTMGVLRWRGLLDFLLERDSKKPIPRLDLAVALALRLGLYQLRFMERIPAHAAVHESVELVRRARKSSAAAFVNAILRRSAEKRQVPAAALIPLELPIAERLAVLYSHPLWLVQRWLARMGEAETVSLLEANNETPRLSCALNGETFREEVFKELSNAGLRIEPGRLLARAFSVSGGSPSHTDAFRNGRISIQDEASQAVPLLLGVAAGERVLDVCAAPGGKTATLARSAGEGGFVLAADVYAHRLHAAKKQFARLQLKNIALVAADAEKPLPFGGNFDRVLVDAPCSGTGTLARHPEIRWRLSPSQLETFPALQTTILRTARAQAAPGARILYSTCSMESEENEQVVASVVESAGPHEPLLRLADAKEARAALAPFLTPGVDAAIFFDEMGAFRTLPHRDRTDGFFAALLVKMK